MVAMPAAPHAAQRASVAPALELVERHAATSGVGASDEAVDHDVRAESQGGPTGGGIGRIAARGDGRPGAGSRQS